MILTIEEKALLAEQVMGLSLIDPSQAHKIPFTPEGAGYYFLKDGRMMITDGSFLHTCWQPETDEGDAARLLMMLPRANVMIGIGDGLEEDETIATFAIPGFRTVLPKIELCKGICTIALQYAREKVAKNEQ